MSEEGGVGWGGGGGGRCVFFKMMSDCASNDNEDNAIM